MWPTLKIDTLTLVVRIICLLILKAEVTEMPAAVGKKPLITMLFVSLKLQMVGTVVTEPVEDAGQVMIMMAVAMITMVDLGGFIQRKKFAQLQT